MTDLRRVLVVEDDADIAELVALHVRDLDCAVEVEPDGERALARALAADFDLVVLDLGLPHLDGVEVCRRLRARERYVPILMLTARDSEVDRVLGLEIGADDYLTKPFSVRELVARIKALFRRVDALGPARDAEHPGDEPLRVGPIVLDALRRSVAVDDRPVELTAKEFDLLALFVRHPGRVFSRDQLLEQVWGYAHRGYDHTVNSHINRLRAKIEPDPGTPRFLLTVWGVGYRFFDPDSQEPGHA